MTFIVYPEHRLVSDEQITSWYLDAVDNEEVDDCEAKTVAAMAAALNDAGLITTSNKWKI